MDYSINEDCFEITEKETELITRYSLPATDMKAIITFHYMKHLEGAKHDGETKFSVLNVLAGNVLEYFLAYGPGKPSSIKLPEDPAGKPQYGFKCDYMLLLKNALPFKREKQKIEEGILICTVGNDTRYYSIEPTFTDVKGIEVLDNLCGCESKGCSLAYYYDLPNIRKIDEKVFYDQINRELSEKVPQYGEISNAIIDEILPLAKVNLEDINSRLAQKSCLAKLDETSGYIG